MASNGRNRDSLILEGVEELNFVLSSMSRSIPSHIEFDDLVQEVLVEVIKAADKYTPYHGSNASFSSYITRNIRTTIILYLRKYGGAGFSFLDVDIAANNGFSSVFSDKGVESSAMFSRACASSLSTESLDKYDSLIIELYFARNQSVRDIANRSGIAASTATRQLNLALDKLKIENFIK